MIVKGSPSYAKNIVRFRVCTFTPFFLNLYSRLSRLLAISQIVTRFQNTFFPHHVMISCFTD